MNSLLAIVQLCFASNSKNTEHRKSNYGYGRGEPRRYNLPCRFDSAEFTDSNDVRELGAKNFPEG